MIKEALETLFNLKPKEIVKYAQLEDVPHGKWIRLSDQKIVEHDKDLTPAVWYKRLSTRAQGQEVFISRIFEGFGYHYHGHDCGEQVTPMTGDLRINNNQVIKKNEQFYFYPKTMHEVMVHRTDNGKYLDVLVEFVQYIK